MQNKIGNKIMTVEEVAANLRVHPFTVLSYIRRGLIDAAKLGRIYRIRESEMERFFDCMVGEAKKPRVKRRRSRSKKVDKKASVPFKATKIGRVGRC